MILKKLKYKLYIKIPMKNSNIKLMNNDCISPDNLIKEIEVQKWYQEKKLIIILVVSLVEFPLCMSITIGSNFMFTFMMN